MIDIEGEFYHARLVLEPSRRQLHVAAQGMAADIQKVVDEALDTAKNSDWWKAEVTRGLEEAIREEIRFTLSKYTYSTRFMEFCSRMQAEAEALFGPAK